MLVLLKLFWTFFKIGLFTIGGGYAMIPLITQEAVANGWTTEIELMNYLAISESTPGPFAVNCATFIGFSQYGVIGALAATLGVISPSFIIILIISKFLSNFTDNIYVKGALKGVKPVIISLIAGTAITLMWKEVFSKLWEFSGFDYKALIIMLVAFIMTRFKKTKNPILVIVTGAILGLVMYGLIP